MENIKIVNFLDQGERYSFFRDEFRNLNYEIIENDIKYKGTIGKNIKEFSIFTENEKLVYVLFKEKEDLKCGILRDKVLSIGTLYSSQGSLYKVKNAEIFILDGKINILATLNGNDDNLEDYIVHYIYNNGKINQSNIGIIEKNSIKNKNYVYSKIEDEVKIFYSVFDKEKETCYVRNYKDSLWSDAKKLFSMQGKIKEFEIKEKDNKIYLGFIYSSLSIGVVKLIILNKDLNLINEKTYYSAEELKNIEFLEDENELLMVFNEKDEAIMASNLLEGDYIKTYKLNIDNLIPFEIYNFKDNKVKVIDKLIDLKSEGRRIFSMDDILNSDILKKQDIFSYSKNVFQILSKQMEKENIASKQLQLKIGELQQEIKNKHNELINIKDNIISRDDINKLDKISQLEKENITLEDKSTELKNKIKKITENLEQEIEKNNILIGELSKVKDEMENYKEIKESNEALKNENLTLKEKIILDKEYYNKRFDELSTIIKNKEEESKGVLHKIFNK